MSLSKTIPIFILITLFTIPVMAYNSDYIHDITNKYLNSFPALEKPSSSNMQKPLTTWEKIKQKVIPQRVRLISTVLSEREMRAIAYQASPTKIKSSDSAFDADFVEKMKLINGGNRPADHLLSRLTTLKNQSQRNTRFVHTIMGEKIIVERLVQPETDINRLQLEQNALKKLIANGKKTDKIDQYLSDLASHESHLLSFFVQEPEGTQKALSKLYFNKWLSALNTNTLCLESKTRINNLVQFISLVYPPLSIAFIKYLVERNIKDKPFNVAIKKAAHAPISWAKFSDPRKKNFKNGVPAIMTAFITSFDKKTLAFDDHLFEQKINTLLLNGTFKKEAAIYLPDLNLNSLVLNNSTIGRIVKAILPKSLGDMFTYSDEMAKHLGQSKYHWRGVLSAYISLPIFLYSYTSWATITAIKNDRDMLNFVHEKLVHVANYVKTAQKIGALIHNDPLIRQAIPAIKELNQLKNPSLHSAKFIQLIRMLESSTFTNATIFSCSGRVLAAYKLLYEVKDEFGKLLCAIGNVDSIMCATKLLNHYQKENAPYCFAHFITHDTPYIEAENFWNVFIQPSHVVTNSVTIGQNSPQTMILTGPNTGGKSTLIEGLLLTTHIAQSFYGIAPAQQLTMTPFAKFTCYHNITDDISLGDSRFKSEVLQSKKQLQTAKELKSGEFSLNIRDEGIVGTDREVGQKAEYTFVKQLGTIPGAINLVSTHYPELTQLENENQQLFKNYYMEILQPDQYSIERTFKLCFGVSTLNIAMNILQEAGLVDL